MLKLSRVHTTQEYGDWENADQMFHIMRKERVITFLDAGSGGSEQIQADAERRCNLQNNV